MSHSVFQTTLIMPLAPTPNSLSSKSLLTTTSVFLEPTPNSLSFKSLQPTTSFCRPSLFPPTVGKLWQCQFTTRASSFDVVDGDATDGLDRCFQSSPPAADAPSTCPSSVNCRPVMKGGQYSAFGAVTLEKSKLDLTKKQTKFSPDVATRGGGGNKGKGLSHGG